MHTLEWPVELVVSADAALLLRPGSDAAFCRWPFRPYSRLPLHNRKLPGTLTLLCRAT
ncbi:hypothetical protein ACNKHW_00305 [Shigella flexneri]